ncbi:hypothetical protein FOZ60_010694 [Perkinsus olseni]|uniref:Uncharacterized protein n=1 Tax=Perkinsus olseni TaxID=32597 RepID=A0A7J6PC03_PEROL|nr:hypothetical protein FOZ60_010694 [Perkinsus olseni]
MWSSSSSNSWSTTWGSDDDTTTATNTTDPDSGASDAQGTAFKGATKTVTEERCRTDPSTGETRCEKIRRLFRQTRPGGPMEQVESTRTESSGPQQWSPLFAAPGDAGDGSAESSNTQTDAFPVVDEVGRPVGKATVRSSSSSLDEHHPVHHFMNLLHGHPDTPHETIVVEQTKPGLGEKIFLSIFGSMVDFMFRHLDSEWPDFTSNGGLFSNAMDVATDAADAATQYGPDCYEV